LGDSLKRISWCLALAGLALATVLIGWFGATNVAEAVLSAGWSGFGLLLGWQVLLFGLLAAAWMALMPSGLAPYGAFAWSRMVRDAVGNCLPFSHMAGVVAGTRALAVQGVRWPMAAAGGIVDATSEFVAQIAFVLVGLVALLRHAPGSGLVAPLGMSLLVAAVLAGGIVWLQQGSFSVFERLARRIAAPWFADASAYVQAVQGELTRLYESRIRLGLGVGLHLLGWIAGGIGTWIAFRLLGAAVGLNDALAIEALTHLALSAAVLVPSGAGVQEAAYASLGAIFGVPAELSLGVSLLRRARDLAVGIPILLIWQGTEARRATFTERATLELQD